MAILVAVVVGLILGSFLSVLIGRWPHFRGAWMGRSHCPACSHVLAWHDLLPVVSWLMLRGRCRYCGTPISALYPVLEVTMAGALGLYAYFYGLPTMWYALDIIVLFGLVSLFFFDLKHQMLPDIIVLPLSIVAVLRLWVVPGHDPLTSVLTGIGIAAMFGALYAYSRGRWLGFGDVKLAVVIGLLFGYPVAVGVTLIAVWAGALVGVALMATRRATMQTALPFGSFWTAAAVVTVLWPAPVLFLSSLFIPVLR